MAGSYGAQGSLLNHSEHRIDKLDTIQGLVNRLRSLQMISVVCARSASRSPPLLSLNQIILLLNPREQLAPEEQYRRKIPQLSQILSMLENVAKCKSDLWSRDY